MAKQVQDLTGTEEWPWQLGSALGGGRNGGRSGSLERPSGVIVRQTALSNYGGGNRRAVRVEEREQTTYKSVLLRVGGWYLELWFGPCLNYQVSQQARR